MRAWIEISQGDPCYPPQTVALFTRAWIEIKLGGMSYDEWKASPSSRGRGLKCRSLRQPC